MCCAYTVITIIFIKSSLIIQKSDILKHLNIFLDSFRLIIIKNKLGVGLKKNNLLNTERLTIGIDANPTLTMDHIHPDTKAENGVIYKINNGTTFHDLNFTQLWQSVLCQRLQ